MNWRKWLKTAVIIGSVVLFGGVLYEAIAGRITNNRSDTLISDLRADNEGLRIGLEDAQSGVAKGKRTVADLEERNIELGNQLSASEGITGELLNENRGLREENNRLGVAIDAGTVSTGRLGDIHSELEGAIGRAWDIVERYPIPTGSE